MIKIQRLCKSYGTLQVLKDLNLEVKDGETVVILGRSGVGKSVLLRQIIGIEQPDSGNVEINGTNIINLKPKERALATMQMGMLFQGAALFDSMDVHENIAFYLRQHERHLSEDEIDRRVAEALEMVDMSGTQQKMPSDLSGGMRKRAALARLVVYRPKILLYDEPTTGLDPITAMQINELIIRTQKELQGTSIVVTHDIKSAITVGDRLAFHDDMRITHIAPKHEFFKIDDPKIHAFITNATLSEAYIDDMHNRSKKQ
jgi:phospholipid/cholesterol/gamma-HCH transport system ATP-binding protein